MTNSITTDPRVRGGEPVIKDTDVMVNEVRSMFEGGYSPDVIAGILPQLSRQDVLAALEYAQTS